MTTCTRCKRRPRPQGRNYRLCDTCRAATTQEQRLKERAKAQDSMAKFKADAAERLTWPKCLVPSCGRHVFEPGARVCRLHQPRPPPPSIEQFIRRPSVWMENA